MATYTYTAKTQQQAVNFSNRIVAFKIEPSSESGDVTSILAHTIADVNGNFTLTWQDWDGRVIVGAIDEDGIIQRLNCVFVDFQSGQVIEELQLSYEDHILAQNPYLYYKLSEINPSTNDILIDHSGNNKTLTHNIPPFDVPPLVHYTSNIAKRFTPDTLYNDADLGTDNLSNKTIELWITFDNVTGHQIFFKEGGLTNGWAFGLLDGKLTVGITSSSTPQQVISSYPLKIDTTYHVAATISTTTNYMALYVNGEKVADKANAGILAHNGSDFACIGNCFTASTGLYTNILLDGFQSSPTLGTIDQFAIYDYILSKYQIRSNYQIGANVFREGLNRGKIQHHFEISESQLPVVDLTENRFNLNVSDNPPAFGYPSVKRGGGSSMYIAEGSEANVYRINPYAGVGKAKVGISVWVRLDPIVTSDVRGLITDVYGSDVSGIYNMQVDTYIAPNGASFVWKYEYDNGSDVIINHPFPFSINDDEPHHIYVDNNYTSLVSRMFLDGVLVSTVLLPTTPSGGTSTVRKLSLGNGSVSGNSYTYIELAGSIQQAIIYQDTLEYEEITWLYNNGLGRDVEELYPFPSDYNAWYDFNNDPNLDVSDKTGLYNGVATSSDIYTTGRQGSGIQTTANPDYITLPAVVNLFDLVDDFTVGFWVYSDYNGSIQVLSLGYQTSAIDGDNKGLRFFIDPTSHTVRFSVRTGFAGGYNGESRGRWDTGLAIPQNQWALVICQRSTATAECYVMSPSGTQRAGVSLGGTYSLTGYSHTSNYILAGSSDGGSSLYYSAVGAKIDDLFVYPRFLTKADIDVIYNEGKGTNPDRAFFIDQTIYPQTPQIGGKFGAVIAYNYDASVMCIAESFRDLTVTDQGQVAVYDRLENGTYSLRGHITIPDPSVTNYSIRNLALDQSGKFIVLSVLGNGTNAQTSLYTYEWDGTDWELIVDRYTNPEIDNSINDSWFGIGIALSGDAKKLVIGAPYTETENTIADAGTVFTFVKSYQQWALVNVFTSGFGGQFGERLAITGDGNTLFIFSKFQTDDPHDGELYIYNWDLQNLQWIESDIQLQVPFNVTQSKMVTISCNYDGSVVIVSPSSPGVVSPPRYDAVMFQLINDQYVEVTKIRSSQRSIPSSGYQTFISSDATDISMSDPLNSSQLVEGGAARRANISSIHPTYQSVLSDDPICFHPLDNIVVDSRSKKNLTRQRPGSAVTFLGTSGYMSAPVPEFSTASPYTLECWCALDGAGDSGNRSISGMQDVNESNLQGAFYLNMRNSGGGKGILFTTYDVGGNAYNVSYEFDPIGLIYHYAVTYDGSYIRLYVNGKLGASLDVTGISLVDCTGDLYIGCAIYNSIPADFHYGRIDEFAVYTEALTHEQLGRHYYYGLYDTMQYKAKVLNDNPVAYYGFDGDALIEAQANNVSSGSAGTLSGSYSINQTGLLFHNPFIESELNGTNQFLPFHNVDINTNQAFTVEVWCKLVDITTGHIMTMNSTDSTDGVFRLITSTGTGVSRFTIYNSSGSGTFVDSNITLTTTSIYHIVAKFTGSVVELYINGTSRGTAAFSGTRATSNGNLVIGCSTSNFGQTTQAHFKGIVACAAVFNYALTPTQITQRFRDGWFDADTWEGSSRAANASFYNTLGQRPLGPSSFIKDLTDNGYGLYGRPGSYVNNQGLTFVGNSNGYTGLECGTQLPAFTFPVTLEAFIQSSESFNGSGSIVSTHETASLGVIDVTSGFRLFISYTTGQLQAKFGDGIVSAPTSSHRKNFVSAAGLVLSGVAYLTTVQFIDINTAKLFLDGIEVAVVSVSGTASSVSTSGTFTVGIDTSYAAGIRPFDGSINHVAVFDKLSNTDLLHDRFVTYAYPGLNTHRERVLHDQPVVAFFFDEPPGSTQLFDYSGNNYHGTFSGNPQLNQPAIFDDADRSIYFNGIDDQVDFPKISELRITGDIYIQVRFKYLEHASYQELVCMESLDGLDSDPANNVIFRLGIFADGRLHINTETGNGVSVLATTIENISPGQSYIVGLRRRSADLQLDFFVDGHLFETVDYTDNPTGGENAVLTIAGDSELGDADNANVYIDSVAIYNKLLSDGRILAHANV